MADLSTVRGQLPDIQRKGVEVMLLNIHEPPTRDLLAQFEFTLSPTYLIFSGNGAEVFRSNGLPPVDEIIAVAR